MINTITDDLRKFSSKTATCWRHLVNLELKVVVVRSLIGANSNSRDDRARRIRSEANGGVEGLKIFTRHIRATCCRIVVKSDSSGSWAREITALCEYAFQVGALFLASCDLAGLQTLDFDGEF